MKSSDGSTKDELYARLLNGIDAEFHLGSARMRAIEIAQGASEEEAIREWEEANGPFPEDGLTVFLISFGGKE